MRSAPSAFRTERLYAARIVAEDIGYIVETDGDRDIQKTLAGRQQTREESQGRLDRWLDIWEQCGYGFWIFSDAAGTKIGHAGIFPSPRIDGSIEVGYALKPAYWNRGYATEMTKAVLEIAADVGVTRVIAITLASNAASRRVLEKAGLSFESDCPYSGGRLGALYSRRILYPTPYTVNT